MFDKIKQINKIREIQKDLEKEISQVEKEGVKVVLNGKMEIEEIILSENLPIAKQQLLVKECHNEAMKKIQIELAKKVQNFSGFGI